MPARLAPRLLRISPAYASLTLGPTCGLHALWFHHHSPLIAVRPTAVLPEQRHTRAVGPATWFYAPPHFTTSASTGWRCIHAWFKFFLRSRNNAYCSRAATDASRPDYARVDTPRPAPVARCSPTASYGLFHCERYHGVAPWFEDPPQLRFIPDAADPQLRSAFTAAGYTAGQRCLTPRSG